MSRGFVSQQVCFCRSAGPVLGSNTAHAAAGEGSTRALSDDGVDGAHEAGCCVLADRDGAAACTTWHVVRTGQCGWYSVVQTSSALPRFVSCVVDGDTKKRVDDLVSVWTTW